MEGSEVKAGQVVGRVSSPEYEAQLRAAQYNVERAKETMSEAESLIDAVDPATGLRCAQEGLELSQNTESMIGEALAERAIGRALAAGKEGPQEALLHLIRSMQICEEIGAKFELARSLLALGAVHLACANRTDAATALTKAKAVAQECELEQEESIAQDLLTKLGLP